jgi:N-methylhydantoinase B
MTHGASQPEAQGLFGGYPSSVQVRLALREANLQTLFARRRIPSRLEDLPDASVEPLAAKQRLRLEANDAVLTVCAGGGGYGDPLARSPHSVLADVEDGLVSSAAALAIYGVVLVPDESSRLEVDDAATAGERTAILARRISEGQPVRPVGSKEQEPVDPPDATRWAVVGAVGAAAQIIASGGLRLFACQRCEHVLSPADANPKTGSLSRDVPMEVLSAWNRYGLTGEIRVREFCCPACGHLLAVEVAPKEDPILFDISLAPPPVDVPNVAAIAE